MNILITSISAKVSLIRAVTNAKNRFNKDILIYGADIDSNVIGKNFVDYFWKIPKLSNITINEIISYCSDNNIKYIIPTRDEDVLYFSKNKNILLKNNIFPFVSNIDSINICRDKYNFYNSNKEFPIISTYLNISNENFNCYVVKERFGSGSKNIALKLKKEIAINFSKNLDSPIFQEYITGTEYSIDSYVNKESKCIASIVRSRDLISNGEAVITSHINNKNIEKLAKKFLEVNNILGHSVLQVIENNNCYHIVECNTRFGGASTLGIKMGCDSFYWFLCESNNIRIEVKINTKSYKQIRIQEDIYHEN